MDTERFVGRQDELEILIKRLDDENSVTLLKGESGMGKTFLLNKFYETLERDYKNKLFVGKYTVTNSSQNTLNHFSSLLGDLLAWDPVEEPNFKEILTRLISERDKYWKAILKCALVYLNENLEKKCGINFLDVLEKVKSTDSAFFRARNFAREHFSNTVYSYIKLATDITEEFENRNLVWIIDQFERIDDESKNFFLDFAETLPKRNHVFISISSKIPRGIDLCKSVEKELNPVCIVPPNFNSSDIKDLGTSIIGESFSEEAVYPVLKLTNGHPLGTYICLCRFQEMQLAMGT